jgi:nucleotide-binding universal stress UspA family protein
MIKRILVGLGTSHTALSVTEHAVELATTFGAELLGLAVTDPLRLEWTGPRPIGVGVEAMTSQLRQQRFEKAQADIAVAEAKFADRCIAADVPHRVAERTGDPFEIAVDLVRYHDMCVFGLRGLFEHDVVPEPLDALERLVASGVRPILAVAEHYRPIRRVLVAYSGSLESAKTFKSFVQSGLFADAAVRVVHFGDDAATARRRLESVAGYFQAHGRTVDTDFTGGDPSSEIVPYARQWGADLIVAGNSAKNLLLRRLFGETALKLLRDSPLPLYLSQ